MQNPAFHGGINYFFFFINKKQKTPFVCEDNESSKAQLASTCIFLGDSELFWHCVVPENTIPPPQREFQIT